MKNILNSNWMPWNSWPSMAATFIIFLCGLAVWGAPDENFDDEHSITRLPTGQRVYETVYKGKTYIIVETHRGVGICPKVEK